ncbi:uncharacterized protein LOC125206219 [Salvia hispanica]|uniref:uncharacterized protein LOC125206219 n=1 Tax=Salvia hispanica TaxID=49212 RepID=UPI0020096B28|nr:uncharacterized protein LOC125206219 [Salvia hispanica]
MSYICTGVDSDDSVMFMFNEAQNSTRHIELFLEYSPLRNVEIPPIVDYGVGSSTRVEYMSFDCGMNEQADVADATDVGMNNQVNVQDNVDVDVVRRDRDPPLSSSSSDTILSDDSQADISSDEEVIYKPVVQVPDVGNEHNTMYWDEEHPYRINAGTKFDSKLHVKTAITMWSLRQHRQFRVVESKLRRWHAKCKYPAGRTEDGVAIISETDAEKANECSWEVSVTQRAHDDMWEIRKWVERHSCEGHRNDRGHANFSSSMIALCIRHQLLKNAEYKAAAVRNFVHDKFHVVISYKKAWYARRRAIEIVFGGWEESFRQLPSYMLELQSRNPGTIVEWKHNELLSQGRNKVFYYVFWALGPAIHAFQECQPVLTIDGTHLRGRFKGKLLVACGVDANKKTLPIAYAVVDEETGDSWQWFLDHVRIHVVKYQREVCIISDRHKGIIKAMRSDEWKKPPICHHKWCLVHLRKNIMAKCKGINVKGKIWGLGITTQVRKYIRRRRALREESIVAIQELNKAKKENWSLCYDDELRWGVTSTNMSESYNRVLKGVRELPIRALVDLTFWRTVQWWADRKTEIQHTEGRLTPWARDKLAANDARGQKHYCSVLDRELGHYQILSRPRMEDGQAKGNNKQEVKFFDSNCTCGKWQMWRVPCSHACTVARDRGNAMFELIDKHNHKATWEAQYSGGPFGAPRHEDYWAKPGWKLCITPEQLLPRKRGPGRRKRIPNQMDVREDDEPRAPRKCRNCGVEGHDRRNCTVGLVGEDCVSTAVG